ncbi:MAG: FtsX-like permease family protein [Defluviitaleaceae bacterium]|nr:FtsX-like permease family protein [Defluviitaleaceae bacterium]
MKNIWIVAKANIKRNKSQAFNISILVLIAAMLLYVGLAVSTGVTTAFDIRSEELNAAHFVTLFQWNEESDQVDTAVFEFITGVDNVAAVETQQALLFGVTLYDSAGASMSMRPVLITRADEHQQMNPPSFFCEHQPLTGNAIYIPHAVFLTGGYALGDAFVLTLMGTSHVFSIAGSTEDIVGGTIQAHFVRMYVSDENFALIAAETPNAVITMASARMYEIDYLPSLVTAFSDHIDAFDAEFVGFASSITHFDARSIRTNNAMILGQLILVFSVILLTIAIVTVRFGIVNNIAESMANIGILKATGYKNRQIIASIVLQFGLIAFAGGVLGVLLAQFIMPLIVSMLAPELSLQWNPQFNMPVIVISFVVTFLLVVAFAAVSSSRIRKLHPIMALRGGTATHSFKKNHLPLDKSFGPLNFLMSMKQMLGNKRQSIMICIIISGLSFATATGVTVHYNINVNRDAMIRVMMGEVSDIVILVNEDENFSARIRNHPEVRSAFGFSQAQELTVNGMSTLSRVAEDTNMLEANTIVTGRFPILDNEIAVGVSVMQSLGLNIGDWVTISDGELEKRLLIVGSNAGALGVITLDGLRHVRPEFVFDTIWMNLHPNVDARGFAGFIREYESDVVIDVGMLYESVQSDWDVVGSVFGIVSWAIVFTVAIVVVLVLYLVIKTVILRRRKDIGIQKALGFTTLQLMNQIAFSTIPPLFAGVIIGAIGSYYAFNPLYAVLLGLSGVARVDLPTPVSWVFVICTALILLAYIVSMLITWRIRKISPYALVSE